MENQIIKQNKKDITKVLPYNIGLALSGGGAKGFAHLGALQALEENGIKPDIISGTSAGAIVGAFYSCGFKPKEILELFMEHDVKDFISFTLPKEAFLKYDGFRKFLEGTMTAKTFEELKIPFCAVAADFDMGVCKVFTEGELVPRVMASCTIPIVFKPIIIDGVRYVDGGLFKNFPVSPIRDVCRKVIGVNVCPKLVEEYDDNILHVAVRSYQFMFKQNAVEDSKLCDLLLEVDSIDEYNIFDMKNAYKIYDQGYEQMTELLESVRDRNGKISDKLNLLT